MKHRIIRLLTIAMLASGVLLPAQPAVLAPVAETAAQREARIAWWREARFGLFIHWGLYAIPGRGEWVQWNEQIPNEEYAKLAGEFNPQHFDAAAWAQIIRDAGMKYAVLTARHHDGFALFDDPGNTFTSVSTAAHRDFVAEYTKAMRAAGVRVGLYYSPLDWRFPGYILPDIQRASAEAMRAQHHRQMEQLMTNYGPLDVIWFDGGETDWLNFGADWKGAEWKKRPREQHYAGGFRWEHDKVYAQLRRLQPQALINGRADMPEDFRSREGDGALGGFDDEHPWELCTTIVRGAWGWQPNAEVKSLAYLVQLLVKAAGRDGNLLLNVGPRPDGQIDPPQAQRLREIGAWLRQNGESIYGTRGGPWLPGDYGVSTHRGNSIYVHVLQWSGESLILPALPVQVRKASRLNGSPVGFVQNHGRLEFTVPEGARDTIDTIIKLDLETSAAGLTPLAPDETGNPQASVRPPAP
jgi:alpha-L-fucosidase